MDQQQNKPTAQPNNGPTKILILEQSAHCDWDWVCTFLQYYTGDESPHDAVQTTFNTAIGLMNQNQPGNANNYFYTFCEMAYLKQYLKDNPTQIDVIKKLAQYVSISSGGITSADNLLSHGEAFIRNYLLGRQWAINELGITPSLQMWVPDDFGHDAQLPIVLQAMGFTGVGFWRIGGNQPQPPDQYPCVPPSETAPSSILLSSVGLDFIWKANDQSSVQAHWLINSYCEGQGLQKQYDPNPPVWSKYTQGEMNKFILQNLSDYTVNPDKPTPIPQPTPYLFVPVDCDFATPFAQLPEIINSWNLCNQNGGSDCFTTPQPPAVTEYLAQMGTFDEFMQLVHEYNETNNTLTTCYSNPSAGTGPLFLPNPYFSGCYGSRPELKFLHYLTTRTLLQAEAMEIFLEYLAFTNASWGEIAAKARRYLAEAWLHLVPSTHHDYITGTANDTVYSSPPPNGEQLHDLQAASAAANKIAHDIRKKIAQAIRPNTTAGVVTVAAFNSLGFGRSGVVEIDSPGEGLVSAVVNGEDYFPVQYTENAEGNPALLFMVDDPSSGMSVPSLGYSTVYLSDHASTITPVLSLQPAENDPSNYVLSNEFLSAFISPQGIIELYDLINDPSQQNNLLKSPGSEIVFYNDSGNIYRFGNELICDTPTFVLDGTITFDWQPLSVTEKGLLRCTLKATDTKLNFTTLYSLVAGEPFLRITTTGAAPSGYSVIVKFPFASPIDTLTYGTAYHWDARGPRSYWPTPQGGNVEEMTFEPTHEFVIPTDSNYNYLAAIYHASTPGWAIDSSGALLGCILRNTPGEQQAAWGTDPDAHTASYALRVAGKEGSATQLLPPTVGCQAGAPLGEALQFNNPLVGHVVPATSSAELPTTMSIASTADPTAVITAAKAGTVNETDLILRVYQPTTNTLTGIQVYLDPQVAQMFCNETLNVAGQTALETSLDSENLSLVPAQTSFTFTAPYAITTLALSRD